MKYIPSRIEKKWRVRWLKNRVYEPDLKRAKRPFYNLMMFPYPSAEGLHMGSVRTFTGVDIYGRLKRMQGHDVFEPIGLDGFGIHSENYALKIGKHPLEHAKTSEKNFYRQLGSIGNGFAWEERLETYDPDYYKWTQWIFVQMFKRGLAYRKKSAVNWCPSCLTVLADEQVISGACERCRTPVVKKDLEQWFFRITDYAERLLKNLEHIDWSEKVKIAQRNWIGKSEGALIDFRIKNQELRIKIFTTRPDTLFGATYMVVAPEHPLIKNFQFSISNFQEVDGYIKKAKARTEADRIAEGKEKTGVELKGIKAVNPSNGEEISVWVADYVLSHVGTGAIMAVPAHDERDFEFAKKFNLPIKIVICPHEPEKTCPVLDAAYTGEGHLVASGKFDGAPSEKAKWDIVTFVGGKQEVQYRLRDWLISRQRYWGPPIPMIFCEACKHAGMGEQKEMPGWFAVPEKDLPVALPRVKEFRPTGTGQSPLASVESFYKVRCPQCASWARRETDVSDTFLDSAWYYLRYPSGEDNKHPWSPATTKKWLPVNMYIGGPEHSVLHLLYVRFCAMAFYDWGMVHFEEPFTVFRAHGLITKGGAKMSKSKGNVVNPDEYIRAFGVDAVRLYLAFIAPFEEGGDFRDTGIRGMTRFLDRVWRFCESVRGKQMEKREKEKLLRLTHQTIKKVTEDIEGLHYNTAISALMVLLNEFESSAESVSEKDREIFLKLLAPFAPFITEELWQRFRPTSHKLQATSFCSVHHEPWPAYDAGYLVADTFTLVIQVNGKVRDQMEAKAGITEEGAKALIFSREKIKAFLGKEPKVRKVIFVPRKLINIVL